MRHYIFTALVYAVLCGSNIQAVEANVTEEVKDVTQEEKNVSNAIAIINAKNEKGEYITSIGDLLSAIYGLSINFNQAEEIKEIVYNNPGVMTELRARYSSDARNRIQKIQQDLILDNNGFRLIYDSLDYVFAAFKKRFNEETSTKEFKIDNINKRLIPAEKLLEVNKKSLKDAEYRLEVAKKNFEDAEYQLEVVKSNFDVANTEVEKLEKEKEEIQKMHNL